MTTTSARRSFRLLLGICTLLLGATAAPAAAAEHRLGLGIHYWKTIDDLENDSFSFAKDEGISWIGSYQFVPARLLRLEVDVEYFDEGFSGQSDPAWSPQLYVVVGNRFYGALGTGVVYSPGYSDSPTDPFYAARLGIDIPLLPRAAHIDVHANYRFNDWNEFQRADTDTITLGAILRFRL